MLGAIPDAVSEQLEAKLGQCTGCGWWDPARLDGPVDVVLRDTTRGGAPLDRRALRNRWVCRPIGTPFPIMRVELLDQLSPDLDGQWLVGNVFTEDGSRLDDFRSVIDPAVAPVRSKYTPTSFRSYGSHEIGACHECGRLLLGPLSCDAYFLAADVADGSPRLDGIGVYAPKATIDRLGLYDRKQWPLGRLMRVEVYDEPRDPFPVPLPQTWDKFEAHEQALGHEVPFPRFWLGKRSPGRWLKQQIERRGEAACLGPRDPEGPWLDTIEHLLFLTRLRALWEPRVRRAVEGLSDDQLRCLILDKRIAAADAGEHFDFATAF